MSRPYRLQSEGCCYHITCRGNDRKNIFKKDTDYKNFFKYLLKAKEKYNFFLFAYALMSNHYHLILETPLGNLSKIMQLINSSYTTYFNIKYKRCGHLFQGRFKSIIVEKDSYLLELTRYIHLNPIRANIVDSPEAYKWSSYNSYIKKNTEKIIDKEELNKYLKMSVRRYKSFVMEGIGEKLDPFENIYGGFILGKTKFIKEKLGELREQVEGGEFSNKRMLTGIDKDKIIVEVLRYYGKKREELNKKKHPVFEKKVAIYLLKRFSGLTNKEIGEEFGLTYSAVSKIASDIETLSNEKRSINKELNRIISHFKG